jgi:signal transduction histidine kinase
MIKTLGRHRRDRVVARLDSHSNPQTILIYAPPPWRNARRRGRGACPHPGLDSLDALVERVGRAGRPVRLQVEGDAVPLPRAIDLSAYRIVQEGLTNSLKHAKASRADVTVRYGAEDFELEVRDDGIGAPVSDGLGHGLVGIQERVKIYGGEMSARPGQGGGFVLTARLPLEGRRP